MTRDPANCSLYLLCVAGQAVPMPPCPHGQVWSIKAVRCVTMESRFNDCPHVHTLSGSNRNSTAIDEASKMSKSWPQSPRHLEPMTASEARLIPGTITRMIEAHFPGHPCTFVTTHTALPHPQACHWFYNCTLSPLDKKWTLVEPLSAECPYPKLFSTKTRTCRNYKEVDCGQRPEFKTPCDYRANSCSQLHCRDCQVRLAGCEGLPDGVHPFAGREWTPWFVTCKDERTLEQRTCNQRTPIFSPLLRTCVTSEWVPKQYGGGQAMCFGRRDGFHPDERGLCSRFFHCHQGRFVNAYECDHGLTFDPDTWTCSLKSRVPPCGNLAIHKDLKRFCNGLADGYHADPYGRCALYINCQRGKMVAYLKCKKGSYNPRSDRCDPSLNLPAPCGFRPNPCQSRDDGVYPLSEARCVLRVTCRNGFVSSIDECRDGKVFDYSTKSCQSRDLTPLPCGIAPSCHGKPDGGHLAKVKGCQYFYICLKGLFQGYDRCHIYKGGYLFNPTSGKCDFPHNICPPCGTKLYCPSV